MNANTRIGNKVCFHPQSFMILTGSNMSGKSTFLRSLGINMVLSGMGSVVCASEANVHLTGAGFYAFVRFFVSESYFFAEIKLKTDYG
jgi:DNA mismatch repair ATPase MutS